MPQFHVEFVSEARTSATVNASDTLDALERAKRDQEVRLNTLRDSGATISDVQIRKVRD